MLHYRTNIMMSAKTKRIVVINNYKFDFDQMLPHGVESYTCTANRECNAYAKCFNNSRYILSSNLIHNHSPDPVRIINDQNVSNSSNHKSVYDIYSSHPFLLYHLQNPIDSTNIITKYTDVVYINTNMYDSRYSAILKLPHNRRELHAELGYLNIKTNENDQFLLLNDQEKEIVIFCTESNLKFISKSDALYVDGTLRYGKDIFYILFTVYVLKNNYRIPVLFSLLPNKYQSSYEEVFQTIQNYCVIFNQKFNIKIVYVDFEKNLHNAVHQIWPRTTVKICRVRLGQAWYRMIHRHGISTEYVQCPPINNYLTKLFGLPFLDVQRVGDCFATELAEIQPCDDRLERFLDCLVENYIDENSGFPPNIWADQSSSFNYTIDACESFHSQFSANFYESYPNIFKFIEILKTIQTETVISIRSCNTIEPNENTIYSKKHFVDCQILDLNCGFISRFEFLSILADEFKSRPM